MELTLSRFDLKPEFDHISTSKITFSKLTKQAQKAVCAVGSGFYEREKTHKVIYPPKKVKI